MRYITSIVIVLAFVLLVGCKPGKPDFEKLQVPEFEQSAWPDAIRLSNTEVHLYVVPSLGRVMSYGYFDSPNMLWVNEMMAPAQPAEWFDETRKKKPATKPAAWKNWGGDKVWPWPQEAWPLQLGRAWPPPVEVDQAPMKSKLMGGLGARLESPVIKGYGVKLVREISLDSRGTRVSFLSRFESASTDLPPADLAVWQIMQIPASGTIYAKLAPGGKIRPLPPSPFESTKEVAPGIVIVNPPPDGSAGKTGLDAETLASVHGEYLFVAHSDTAAEEADQFHTGERAQVFFQIRPPPAKKKKEDIPAPATQPSPYLEFEFTSPRKDIAGKQSPELRVTWELHKLEDKKWKDEDVVKILNGS